LPDWSVQLIQTLFVTVSIKRTVEPGTGVPSEVRTIPVTADGGFADCWAELGPAMGSQNIKSSRSCSQSKRRLEFPRADNFMRFALDTWPFYPLKNFSVAHPTEMGYLCQAS
jgi:hypothetical protein